MSQQDKKDDIKELKISSLEGSTPSLTEDDVRNIINDALTDFAFTTRVERGYLQSGNYQTGIEGWKLFSNGDAELNNVLLRGGISEIGTTYEAINTTSTGYNGPVAVVRRGLVATTAVNPSQDSYVDQANPATNYGTNTSLQVSGIAGNQFRSFVQFDITALPTVAEKVIIRLYNASTQSVPAGVVYRVTSSWDQATVTWNTAPGYTENWGTVAYATGAGYKELDITTLYNAWQAGTYTNYGIAIVDIGTLETNTFNSTNNASNKPEMIVYATNATSGLIQLADSDSSLSANNFVGFIPANQTLAPGDTTFVVTQGIVTGFSGLTAGKDYFLSGTPGVISTTQTNYRVGKALSTTTLSVEFNPYYAESWTSAEDYGGFRTVSNAAASSLVMYKTVLTGFRSETIIAGMIADYATGTNIISAYSVADANSSAFTDFNNFSATVGYFILAGSATNNGLTIDAINDNSVRFKWQAATTGGGLTTYLTSGKVVFN